MDCFQDLVAARIHKQVQLRGSRIQQRDGHKQYELDLVSGWYSKRIRDQHRTRNFHDHTWLHSSLPNPCRIEKQERGKVRAETHFWILLPSSLLPQQHRGSKVVLHASLWLPYMPSIMLVQLFVQLCSQSDPEMA